MFETYGSSYLDPNHKHKLYSNLIHHLYKLQIYGKPTEKPTWFGYNIIFKITVYHDIVRNQNTNKECNVYSERCLPAVIHTRHESKHSHQIWRAFKLLLKAHGILQQFNTRILPISLAVVNLLDMAGLHKLRCHTTENVVKYNNNKHYMLS